METEDEVEDTLAGAAEVEDKHDETIMIFNDGDLEEVVMDSVPLNTDTGNECAKETDDGGAAVGTSELESTDQVLVIPKRKLKDPSPVWDNGAVMWENGIKCNFCGKNYSYNSSNTSNIMEHIITKHSDRTEGKTLKRLRDDNRKKRMEKLKDNAAKKVVKQKIKQSDLKAFFFKKEIDPVRKKKIDEAILKYVVVENKPLDTVEKHAFRDMMFTLEPGYICPSDKKFRGMIDNFTDEVKKSVKKEINKDLSEVEDKVVHITSDHGTSHDKLKTHKNALTISWCTKTYEIKTDTIAVMKVYGSQTGDVIRSDVKRELDVVGRNDTWKVNWMTDGEKKQINARTPGKHPQIGLETYYTASCVDHTAHLCVEDAVTKPTCSEINASTTKAHKFINSMKDSNLMKEAFYKIMLEAGENPLAIIQGTSNRWYFKYLEMKRILELKVHVEKFQEEYENINESIVLSSEDWHNLLIYVNSLQTLSNASNLLEGQTYPTASCVIPFLDQVFSELDILIQKLPFKDKPFPSELLSELKSSRRFPKGYKEMVPYNFLTLLDVRHMDIYYTTEETDKAVSDICNDPVFDNIRFDEPPVVTDSTPTTNSNSTLPLSSFAARRQLLLASKQQPQEQNSVSVVTTLKERIKAEVTRFLTYRGSVDDRANPQLWWLENEKQFKLLAKVYRAQCAFPATSTPSERVFNMEGLVVTKFRKSLDPDRAANLVISQDFLRKRQDKEMFRLCRKCTTQQCYVACCKIHNS